MARAARDTDEVRNELRKKLLTHARSIVKREGTKGLTMRALAREAGTAVGLSYKAFTSRDELLWELAWGSLRELIAQIDDWSERTGGDLATRIMEFATLHFDSLAPDLVDQVSRGPRGDEFLRAAAAAGATRSWAAVMTAFLESRQRTGEVREDADTQAFGFVLTAAIHHVLVTEPPLPVPDRPALARHIAGVAALLTSRP
ncbi:TetR/AcrR family transcriptional regulator [Glaciibacter superstes]|uniref:TetR/AcrR family transcriptional regulator n=1 Tax=Glaciibacter superstes TaxID=501023 RepID=UPI0003B79E2F|nr:TetR/AcrR family transcriptional regulator [Glaciibacter superstes]